MCFACFRGRHSSKLTSKVPATAKQGSSKSVLLGTDHYTASSSVIKQIVGSPDSEICEQTTMSSGRSCKRHYHPDQCSVTAVVVVPANMAYQAHRYRTNCR